MQRVTPADADIIVSIHFEVIVAFDPYLMVTLHVQVFVLPDVLDLISADREMGVGANSDHTVVLDANVLIFLGMDKYLLAALLILETDLVKPAAPFGAVRFDGALGLFVGQLIRRHLIGVVDAAHYDG